MTTAQLKRRISTKLDKLGALELRRTDEFIDWISQLPDDSFGQYLRNRPPIEKRHQKAMEDIKAGRVTPVENLRRKH